MTRSVLLALLLVSCQALVDSDLGTVECEAEGVVGPPACPTGQWCQHGECVPCGTASACQAGAAGTAGEAGTETPTAGSAGEGMAAGAAGR